MTVFTHFSILRDEWDEIREIISGPPPQCTDPAALRRVQDLLDLHYRPAVVAFQNAMRRTTSRPWTRQDTFYYYDQH